MKLEDNPNAWRYEDGRLGCCLFDELRHCCKPIDIKTFGQLKEDSNKSERDK